MPPAAPPWRVYLVAVLIAVWAILAVRTGSRGNWIICGLCLLMMAFNAYQLWTFTRRH